jgi:hypothetical protein
MATFVIDKDILWLEVPKKGTPTEWVPGAIYNIGDTVIPRTGFPVPPEKVDVMFQAAGFVGKSAGSAPTFPLVLNNKVVDGNVEWITRDPDVSPFQISVGEYYLIKKNITVS